MTVDSIDPNSTRGAAIMTALIYCPEQDTKVKDVFDVANIFYDMGEYDHEIEMVKELKEFEEDYFNYKTGHKLNYIWREVGSNSD